MQTHAEETLAKADAALRQKENELTSLRSEHLALKEELTAVKNCLGTFTERVQKLHEEGQVGILTETSRFSRMINYYKELEYAILIFLCLLSLKTVPWLALRLLTSS